MSMGFFVLDFVFYCVKVDDFFFWKFRVIVFVVLFIVFSLGFGGGGILFIIVISIIGCFVRR